MIFTNSLAKLQELMIVRTLTSDVSRLALFHCSVADQVRTSMKRFSPVDYCSIPISDGGMSCCHALGIGTL